MSKIDKEKLCIKFVNQFSYKSICLNDVYNIFEWFEREDLFNKDGEEFIATFWKTFIEEMIEDD